MHSYDFRLRFNMAESYRIGSDLDGFDLLTPQTSENIRLRSGGMGTPVKNHDNAAILGGSFASEDEARVAAEKSKRALLYWAVEHRVGIDFGDGKQRSYATKEGLEWWQKKCGCPCRNDILGIDVYEHEENIKFVSCTANPTLMKSPNILITTFQHEYLKNRQLTEKQVLASEIYASSFFDISARSRFITLVPAVEALIEQRKYSADVQEMVDKFVEIAHQTTIDNTTKNSIIGRLEEN